MSGANYYLLASVAIVCGTLIWKRNSSPMFGSNDIGLQIKRSKEEIEKAIDKAILIVANKMETNFTRLETQIDVLENKIDHLEATVTGAVHRVDGFERDSSHTHYINLAATLLPI